jgi:acetyltransferase-like isoleucine patch superfamily enzyme
MERRPMPEPDVVVPAWTDGPLPPNVQLAPGSTIAGKHAFRRFRSRVPDALMIGEHCCMDGVHFALGHDARVRIGKFCYFTNAVLLCELELQFGDYVMIGWNATVADSDFHPLDPALRIQDALACSPLSQGNVRPPLLCRPVVVEDDVWIGPNAAILKGVRIGTGAIIEPGALVTHDVPARCRVLGNPAQIVERL